jgi:hypothetical protein
MDWGVMKGADALKRVYARVVYELIQQLGVYVITPSSNIEDIINHQLLYCTQSATLSFSPMSMAPEG